LVRAGRFEDDPLGGVRLDPSEEFSDACGRVGKTFAEGGGANVNIQEVLGVIDANEGAVHEEWPVFTTLFPFVSANFPRRYVLTESLNFFACPALVPGCARSHPTKGDSA
jgi:hypothetical protein